MWHLWIGLELLALLIIVNMWFYIGYLINKRRKKSPKKESE
ncbi:MAG: hypothetical protein QXH24_00110 [Candidatus Bathyarchaeia archaeon]